MIKFLNFIERVLYRYFDVFLDTISICSSFMLHVKWSFGEIVLLLYCYFTTVPFYFFHLYFNLDFLTVKKLYFFFCYDLQRYYYRFYFRKKQYRYGWRKARRLVRDSTLHEMVFTREFAFVFFYTLFFLFLLYCILFLLRPSFKLRLFERNNKINNFFELEYFAVKRKQDKGQFPLEKVSGLKKAFASTFFGHFFLVRFSFFFFNIRKFFYKFLKGKKGFMEEYDLYRKDREFQKKYSVDFYTYEKHLLEEVKEATRKELSSQPEVGDNLRYLHFSRIFGGDFPERDRFVIAFWPFYVDYSFFNFKIVEQFNFLYKESFMFKGFKFWNFRTGNFLWLNLTSKMNYKDYIIAFRPYETIDIEGLPFLHRAFMRHKASLHKMLKGCFDGF